MLLHSHDKNIKQTTKSQEKTVTKNENTKTSKSQFTASKKVFYWFFHAIWSLIEPTEWIIFCNLLTNVLTRIYLATTRDLNFACTFFLHIHWLASSARLNETTKQLTHVMTGMRKIWCHRNKYTVIIQNCNMWSTRLAVCCWLLDTHINYGIRLQNQNRHWNLFYWDVKA